MNISWCALQSTYDIVSKALLVIVGMTEYSRYLPLLVWQSFFGGLCVPFSGPNFQFICFVYKAGKKLSQNGRYYNDVAQHLFGSRQRKQTLTLSHSGFRLKLPWDESMSQRTKTGRLRYESMPLSMGIPQNQLRCPENAIEMCIKFASFVETIEW